MNEEGNTYKKNDKGIIVRTSRDGMKSFIIFNKKKQEVAFPTTCNINEYFAKGFTKELPDPEADKRERELLREELIKELKEEQKQEQKAKKAK